MADDEATICPEEFNEWQEAYEEYEEANHARHEAKEDVARAWAEVFLACPAAVGASPSVVGGLLLGGACAAALWDWYDSYGDWKHALEEWGEKMAESNDKGEEYNKCVADHKKDNED